MSAVTTDGLVAGAEGVSIRSVGAGEAHTDGVFGSERSARVVHVRDSS